jgi:hypothetical protein
VTGLAGAALDFGSLNEHLHHVDTSANLARSIDKDYAENFPDIAAAARSADRHGARPINILRSAGPVSDAFIFSTDPVAAIVGPQGSGKTIASAKKELVEAQRMRPGADGSRRHVLGVWRQKYDNLWKATIPSWWKVFPKDLPGSTWTGASPRAAMHTVRFEDQWGPVTAVAMFLAFGDIADPDDLRGFEFMDTWLNEMDTMPLELLIYLIGRVGRDPPQEISGRQGRLWGDFNAPDVLNWSYNKFYENPPEGFRLYRQPGGLHPDAENIEAVGRDYYHQQIKLNADNPWWVRRMVHAIPGITRAAHLVYDKFDETRMLAKQTISVEPILPVLVGEDGGLTPAAVYCQEMPDGQLRVLAEVALERGGIEELGEAMLALEARRFPRCDFDDNCDPSMLAGEDRDVARDQQLVSKGSDRQRLADKLGRPVRPALSQEPGRRWDAVRAKSMLNLGAERPGLLIDPSCKGLIRGFLQTYQFRMLRGTNDLSSIAPSFDTHVHDALQYAALKCGSEAARKRKSDVDADRRRRKEEARELGRYDPRARRRVAR